MELVLKLVTLICCVGAVAFATSISNSLKSGGSRRIPRNSLGRHDEVPNPQFLFLRRAPPAKIPAHLYENLVLECEAGGSPPPTIHWLRNGKKMNIEQERNDENNAVSEVYTPIVGIGSTKSRLYLDCMGPQDEAEYTCVAQTPYQGVSRTSHLEVKAVSPLQRNSICVSSKKSLDAPARIIMWTGNILETEGNDVVLFCRTLGSPVPHTTWFMNDDVISNNAKYQVQENGDLLIRNIDWNDMGEYSCVVDNPFGRDVALTFLYPAKKDDD